MHDPLRPHSHDPNPEPPSADPTFTLSLPDGRSQSIRVDDLHVLAQTDVANCTIVSTGHGISGPFTFTGVTLLVLVEAFTNTPWTQVEVISADDFGTRLSAAELLHPDPAGPVLLAHTLDGRPMTRQQGLVRLIVPSERDDALRQVKWVTRINVKS
jgi:DMSO/TMAO reductase YedYZ molybdopterin-dependent catalytic subunit